MTNGLRVKNDVKYTQLATCLLFSIEKVLRAVLNFLTYFSECKINNCCIFFHYYHVLNFQKFRTGDNSLVDSDVGIHSRGEEEQAWTWTQDGHEAEQLEQEIMKVYAADK